MSTHPDREVSLAHNPEREEWGGDDCRANGKANESVKREVRRRSERNERREEEGGRAMHEHASKRAREHPGREDTSNRQPTCLSSSHSKRCSSLLNSSSLSMPA
eukprot:3417298-Rhodomonas_salina.1